MKAGKIAAQAAHGSVGATLIAYTRYKGLFSEWDATGMKKVVLKVKNEQELQNLYNQAIQANIPAYLVRDAGLTTFHGQPTLTVAVIGPTDNWQLDPLVGNLKLL